MGNGYKAYEVTIEGTAPIVMHNGQTANPLNGYSKAIKELSAKRKKVDADHEKIATLEWEASLYLDHDSVTNSHKVIIAGQVVEACIIGGAKRSKMGQAAKIALFVEGDAKFLVGGKELMLEDIKSKNLNTGCLHR